MTELPESLTEADLKRVKDKMAAGWRPKLRNLITGTKVEATPDVMKRYRAAQRRKRKIRAELD